MTGVILFVERTASNHTPGCSVEPGTDRVGAHEQEVDKMKATRFLPLALAAALGLAGLSSAARAQSIPRALRGKIITSGKPIDIPGTSRNFVKKMKKQDRKTFSKDAEGKWVIHFVAFFNRALPVESIKLVVLDAKGEAVALADVGGEKGQRTLASLIVVDTTESPGAKHTLQVYYAKGKKPVVLAKKVVVLK